MRKKKKKEKRLENGARTGFLLIITGNSKLLKDSIFFHHANHFHTQTYLISINPLRAQTSFSFKDLMRSQGEVRSQEYIQLLILVKYLRKVILNKYWKYSIQVNTWSRSTQHAVGSHSSSLSRTWFMHQGLEVSRNQQAKAGGERKMPARGPWQVGCSQR